MFIHAQTVCQYFTNPHYFFFFNDTATTEIYTLSLHDALPICGETRTVLWSLSSPQPVTARSRRSEEHTSELQSHSDLVCRLLLEKKKKWSRDSHSHNEKNKKILIIHVSRAD